MSLRSRRLTATPLTALALMWAGACTAHPPEPGRAPPAEAEATPAQGRANAGARAGTGNGPRVVPYEGALGSPTPPSAPLSSGQKPLEPWVTSALQALWQRPSPKGPEPIALSTPRALHVSGGAPVIQVLPGPAAFADKVPPHLKTVMPKKVPYSNNVQRLRRGSFRLVAFDRTLNDTKLSRDSMEVEIAFTDHEGAEWRIEQVMLAPISPNPVAEPWFGGVAIDTLYHGDTGNGTPAEPLVNCALCSWGWADVYKNGKRVASSALLHIMVTSDTRGGDFKYMCYDCSRNPVREVHVIIPPMFYLPAPGGFLHVMWESADVRRGTPREIARAAPRLGQKLPTIELVAAPYLRWDKEQIHVKAGQKYRLVVHNEDPTSVHQFSLHSMPESTEEKEQPGDLRHEHGATAGRTGPFWKPEQGGHEHGGDPPTPRNVFLTLPQGATWATVVQFDRPGEYAFMCPVGNHYRRGMHGKFIVSAAGEGGAK